MKELLIELDNFRTSKHFLKFGFATGGKHHDWIKKAVELSKSKNKDEAEIAKYLTSLGCAYVISDGKETDETKELRKLVNEGL